MLKLQIPLLRKMNWLGVLLIGVFLLLGVLATWYTVDGIQQKMKNNLLQKASITAHSIDAAQVQKLSGTRKDISKPAYQQLKARIMRIRKSQSRCKFLYLMGKNKKGEVFFYVDSQPENSEDYAPPGLVYSEVSDAYLQVFNNPGPSLVGPVKDRWGRLMTALIPVYAPNSDQLIALLGMDMTTNYWMTEIFKRTAPVIVLVIISILLVFYVQQLRISKNQKKSRQMLRQSEEQYQALFEQAADGILIGNEGGVIINVNQSITNLTGYSREELLGKNINRLFSPSIDDHPYSTIR